jgi:tight adherence protein B
MSLLIIAFLFMGGLTFSLLFFAMRPNAEQKAIEKRFNQLKAASGQVAGEMSGLFLTETDAGSFAWIETIARYLKLSKRLQALIVHADVEITLGKLLFFCALTGIGVGIGAFVLSSSLLLSIPLALVSLSIPIFVLRLLRDRRLDAFNKGLADSIDMMARSLRAGHSVVAAIGIVAEQAVEPVKSEFNEVFKKQNYGLPLREALMQLLDRIPSQDLRVLVTGMLVQKETGGNLADILDRITFVIRERVRIRGEIRTHTAQGRMTGWILCLLPIVMLGLINWINPGYSKVLFNTQTGQRLLFGGLFLLCLGGIVIRGIINGIEI